MRKSSQSALLLGIFMIGSLVTLGQEKPAETSKDVIKIRIEKEKDGKRTIEERVIDTSKMTSGERQIRLEKIQDSLSVPEGNRKMTVIVTGKDVQKLDELDETILWEGEGDIESSRHPRPRGSRVYSFRMDGESLGGKMREMGEEIPSRLEMVAPHFRWDTQLFREWEKSTFKGVDIFPNKPSTDVLNIRFTTETEGDVQIKVLDLQGKVVAEEEVKKHNGEFVGQIKLKKNTKGVHFILLTQGEDGISRRISL